MPHLSSYTEFKRTLANIFLRDREFVDLVTNTENHPLPASDLLSRQVFLYDYIDGTIKEDKTYVCIEVDDGPTATPAAAYFTICIYIAVPKSLMEMNGEIRRDAIAQRVDQLINGSTKFGFGKLKKKPGGRFLFNEAFRCRVLNYSSEDWNRHGETLWETK